MACIMYKIKCKSIQIRGFIVGEVGIQGVSLEP